MIDADELKALLEERLPRYAAPYALKRRLAGTVAARRPRTRWRAAVGAGFAAAAAVALTVVLWPRTDVTAASVDEHVRLLARAQPVDVPSGGIHQVKPWFTGKLDFAPRVAFAGDDEFPLVGGSLAELHGRRAAAFVWKRRLHSITLFVFRADQLRVSPGERVVRGFEVLSWRDGDLGYVLVSDVSRADLEQLRLRLF
jgi:anti-sigma factor RsiW